MNYRKWCLVFILLNIFVGFYKAKANDNFSASDGAVNLKEMSKAAVFVHRAHLISKTLFVTCADVSDVAMTASKKAKDGFYDRNKKYLKFSDFFIKVMASNAEKKYGKKESDSFVDKYYTSLVTQSYTTINQHFKNTTNKEGDCLKISSEFERGEFDIESEKVVIDTIKYWAKKFGYKI